MKKFLVFLAEGFEEIEALSPVDFLRRVGVDVDTVSITKEKKVLGAHGIPVIADKIIDEINSEEYMGLYIPGGIPGSTNLRDNERVIELVKEFNKAGKILSSICAGPIVLDKAGVIKDKKVTSYPSFEDSLKNIGEYIDDEIVVEDGNIITGRGPAIAAYEAFKLVEIIKGKESLNKLKDEIQQLKVEKYYGFKS